MIRYFEKGLKPSIKAEIYQNATHLDDYKELVAKVVKAKAKAGLQPSFYIQKTDIQVVQGSWLAHINAHKIEIQGTVNCRDNFKASKAFASAFTQDFEPSNKAKKNKKKKHYKNKRDLREPKDSTNAATRVNKAKVDGKKKKDISEITCYNYNK